MKLKELFVGIIGSRVRNKVGDLAKLEEAYLDVWERYNETHFITIVSGGAWQGGDKFAMDIARRHGNKMIIFFPDLSDVPAGLEGQGLAEKAYWTRNELIARQCDILIAAPRQDRHHCGTRHTMFRFTKIHDKGELIEV